MSKTPSCYYTAKPLKFLLLSLCSFGAYDFYWFYKNWQRYRMRTGKRVWPGWRATFSPVTAFWMFRDIEKTQQQDDGTITASAAAGAAYLVFWACWLLPGPWQMFNHLTIIPILLMNNRARAVNRRDVPEWKENGRFGVGSCLLVFFGGLILSVSLGLRYLDYTGFWDRYLENSPYAERFDLMSRLK